MFIGKLNQRLQSVTCEVTRKNTKVTPVITENGNPFLGERLQIAWEEVLTTGVDLHVTIPDGYLVNTLAMHLEPDCHPTAVSVYTADKKALLCSYKAQTGKTITDPVVELPVDEEISQFVIEISVDFSGIMISEIAVYGADMEGIALYPLPQKFQCDESERISVDALCSYTADCADGAAAGEILAEKFLELTGTQLTAKETGEFCFRFDKEIPVNGYKLTVSRENITIAASDLRGFVMGAERFVELMDADSVPVCTVEDAPFMPMRGVHLMMPSVAEMPYVKRVIKYILSPGGYNFIILEMAGCMRFDSHPEIAERFMEAVQKGRSGEWPRLPHASVGDSTVLEKDEVREFLAYIRRFGIEPIPEIQSLGHVEFLTLAHPEIAERPAVEQKTQDVDTRLTDKIGSEFYASSYCPSNPKSYEILFDLIDELVEVFQPKEYVHMGHDEVVRLGICPICSQKDPAELFAQDVNKIHDYLAKKGLKMMIWSDMLQPLEYYTKGSAPAIDKIPKDIVMLDFIWYFHLKEDIETLLLDHGFKVGVGNLYSSHFPRYESRVRKAGMVGGQLSSWVTTKEAPMARSGKLYDLQFTANMLWSEQYQSGCHYAYDRIIKARLPKIRAAVQEKTYPSLLPAAKEEVVLDRGAFDPENTPLGGEFSVMKKAASVRFDHATTLPIRRIAAGVTEQIGEYIVTYADGTTVSEPVTYCGNVGYWNRRQNQPYPGGYYRHFGYNGTWYTDGQESRLEDGRIATAYRYEWINPHPELEIEKIAYVPEENAETQVVVNRISVIIAE